MSGKLVPLHHSQFEGLTCTISEVTGLPGVLVVAFTGRYTNERLGHDQPDWMIAQAAAAAAIEAVRLIILDLQAFDYQMGNRLLNLWTTIEGGPFHEGDIHRPVWTVTGPACDERIRSLFAFGGRSDAHVFPDVESALKAAAGTSGEKLT